MNKETKVRTCDSCHENSKLTISNECAACVKFSEWKDVEG